MDVRATLPELVQDVDDALRQILNRIEDDSFVCEPADVENILQILNASLLLWQGHLELLQIESSQDQHWINKQIPDVSARLEPVISVLQDKLEKPPENVVLMSDFRKQSGIG